MASSFQILLPPHGVPMKISEIVTSDEQLDGKSVRIVGRVDLYDASKCLAVLSEPNRPAATSRDQSLTVDTRLTDASDFRLGSQVMLIGELEKRDEQASHGDKVVGDVVLKARVSKCVDRLDYALYCKAVDVWRTYDRTNGVS